MDPSQVLDLNQTSTASFDAGYSMLMVVVALALVFLNGFFVLSEFSIVKAVSNTPLRAHETSQEL
ncbi:hypothetical protein ACISOQ_09435, partial [Campylobacter jejuni]